MVLDSVVNGEFVFKNTYRRMRLLNQSGGDYQVKVPVASQEAPDEFYFVHIKATEGTIYLAIPCVLMLQTSCEQLIEQCHEFGIVTDKRKKDCLSLITREDFHVDTRTSLTKILLPCSALTAAVSRVNIELKFTLLLFKFRSQIHLCWRAEEIYSMNFGS